MIMYACTCTYPYTDTEYTRYSVVLEDISLTQYSCIIIVTTVLAIIKGLNIATNQYEQEPFITGSRKVAVWPSQGLHPS